MLWPFLLVHICGAVIGLLSGYMAMTVRKGSGWHGAAGTVFFGSMIAMSLSGAFIAATFRPNAMNVVVALLTFYLVVTSWWTARHRDGRAGTFEVAGLLFALAVGVAGVTWGLEAANSPTGKKDAMPAMLYFIFGSIALLCAFNDVRLIRRGGTTGPQRIARHLSRMCLALLIATVSFYPGQAKLFPMWLRETKLLLVPHMLLIASMIFHAVRMRARKRAHKAVAAPPDAIAARA